MTPSRRRTLFDLDFYKASLARLSSAETLADEQAATPMELDSPATTTTTTMELDRAVAASSTNVPAPRLHRRESPKDRAAHRKLLLNLHTPSKPKKTTTSTSSSSATAPDPAAVLRIDRTLAPPRNVRARGF